MNVLLRAEGGEVLKLDTARWHADEGGYAAMQSTRPRTLAHALADSPVGLAAWMYALVRWTQMERGGHFPALEATDALAAEIVAFFDELR